MSHPQRKRKRRLRHDIASLTVLYEQHGLKALSRGQIISLTKAGVIPKIRSERERQLRARYGLTLDDYEALLMQQNDVCAVCKQTWHTAFYVDHNHKTGSVRGLLCAKCNTLVGQLETAAYIHEALDYIEKDGVSYDDRYI